MDSLEALLIIVLLGGSSRGLKSINTHFNLECFDKYLTERSEIAVKYKDSHLACQYGEVASIWPLRTSDVEDEKEHFAQATDDMCWNLRACNLIKDTKKCLQCYAKTAMENASKFMGMHFNASSIVIDLSDEYDEDDRNMMRCTLQADQAYATDSSDAFRDFLRCLK